MSEPRSIVELTVRVAQVVPCTEAEGPGRRFALWFQGCPLRCPGCCNPEMLPFEGGELLAHAAAGAALARVAHALGLNVMVFSGYLLEEARQMSDPAVSELLAET